MNVYLQSEAQISIQEPLSSRWFEEPIWHDQRYVRALEPNYKNFIDSKEARRIGRLLKRSIAASFTALQRANVSMPEVIVSGTGLGCVEHTEKFLKALIDNDEELLPPTAFMQSTHNTIGSQIAILLGCKEYNSTYSHRGMSFDSALLDVLMQFEINAIRNALVIGNDELTPDYFNMLDKIGYWKKGDISVETLRQHNSEGSFAGECSAAFLVSDCAKDALCQIRAMEITYAPNAQKLQQLLNAIMKRNNLSLNGIDAFVMGLSGDKTGDDYYLSMYKNVGNGKPLLWYKHIFGESYTASALGLHVAATVLQNGYAPSFLNYHQGKTIKNIENILLFNHFEQKDVSLILLTKC